MTNLLVPVLLTMARQKQATPLQRATSSELMHMLPDDLKANGQAQQQNGSVGKSTKDSASDSAQETPGLMQLAICVLGIYASLYVTTNNPI